MGKGLLGGAPEEVGLVLVGVKAPKEGKALLPHVVARGHVVQAEPSRLLEEGPELDEGVAPGAGVRGAPLGVVLEEGEMISSSKTSR